MPRQSVAFRQADIARAVKGAKAAGLNVTRVEIGRDGKIVMSTGEGAPAPEPELDRWRRERGQS